MNYCQIELTNLCNLSCTGCLRNKMKRKMGVMQSKTFDRTLDICSKLSLNEVWLHNWGEPLLHPDLIEFIARASKKFKVGFATNGTLLTEPTLIALRKSGLTHLDLSLNKNTHNLLYSDHLYKLYERANSLGIDCRFRTVVYSIDDFNFWRNLLNNYKVRYQRLMFYDYSTARKNDCKAIDRLFFVYWDGMVIPCCMVSDGEIVYGKIFDRNIIDKIKRGIKNIHNRINSDKAKKICKYCSEIKIDIPLPFKL